MTEACAMAPAAPSRSQELRKGALGVSAITFFVVSAAAPLTAVAGGAPIAMLMGNGAGLAGAYLLVTLAVLLFSVGYTAMARNISNSGAFYAFTVQGLGGIMGGGSAMVALVAYNAMQAGIYGMFGAATSTWLASTLGLTVPWWACAFAAMAAISVLGYRNVDLSAKVLGLLVAGEFLVVLILDIAILRQGGDAGLSLAPFSPSVVLNSGSLVIAALFAFASFVGFEATSIYSEEAREPRRTIPRATYLSVLLIGAFYTFTTWCMANGEGIDKIANTLKGLQDPTTFLFLLSDRYVGPGLTQAMSLLFITSLFAALLAFHNAVARYFFALGRERLLPGYLGNTHDIHQSPHLGSVVQSVVAFLLVGLFAVTEQDPVLSLFSWLTNIGALGVMLLMAVTSFSVVAFFRRNSHLEGGVIHTKIVPLLSGLLLTGISWAAIKDFDVLTGASSMVASALPATLLAAMIFGMALASRLKKIAPDFYAELGSHRD